VVSIVEAWFVTGQAKNLLEFALRSRSEEQGIQPVSLSLVTYERGRGTGEKNRFVTASREAGVPLDLVTERGRFDRSVIAQIRQIVADRKPDIIQTHNVKSHFLMRVSGLARSRRWLAFHHGYTTTDLKMRCYNQIDRWSLRGADRVVTVCGPFARDIERMGVDASRIIVRHNSVRPFSPADDAAKKTIRESFPPDLPTMLVVGRLSHEKGHLDLLSAIDILRRKNQRFHVVLVGDGPERARIDAALSRMELETFVTMSGLQHDMRPWYGIADAVVMPSHSEGSPNVLLESMAAGVPVIATRVGGVPEIAVDGETALLVPPRDPEAMAAAIARLLDDAELRKNIVRRAREVADNEYSPAAYRRALVGIYQDVLGDAPSR
jgi:glycosyltransferase involved in cell wall biosynthesis